MPVAIKPADTYICIYTCAVYLLDIHDARSILTYYTVLDSIAFVTPWSLQTSLSMIIYMWGRNVTERNRRKNSRKTNIFRLFFHKYNFFCSVFIKALSSFFIIFFRKEIWFRHIVHSRYRADAAVATTVVAVVILTNSYARRCAYNKIN